MDYTKIIGELSKIEKRLKELMNTSYKETQEEYQELCGTLRMIIRRVYPEKDIKKIISNTFPIAMAFGGMTEEQEQKFYISDVKSVLRGVKTIKQEYELFDFKDFTPVKEKTEWKLGLNPKNIFYRKEKKK